MLCTTTTTFTEVRTRLAKFAPGSKRRDHEAANAFQIAMVTAERAAYREYATISPDAAAGIGAAAGAEVLKAIEAGKNGVVEAWAVTYGSSKARTRAVADGVQLRRETGAAKPDAEDLSLEWEEVLPVELSTSSVIIEPLRPMDPEAHVKVLADLERCNAFETLSPLEEQCMRAYVQAAAELLAKRDTHPDRRSKAPVNPNKIQKIRQHTLAILGSEWTDRRVERTIERVRKRAAAEEAFWQYIDDLGAADRDASGQPDEGILVAMMHN